MVQKLEEDGRMSERQMTWRIGGMHCPKCESAVVKAVSALPGIREAQSDWRRGTLTALWDSDVTSKDALVASVAEAGYALETQSGNRIFRTVAVLLAAALLFVILELTPLRAMLSAFPTARAGMGFATLFALGLTTSLHCVGMCGGINLAQSAGAAQISQYRREFPYDTSKGSRRKSPVELPDLDDDPKVPEMVYTYRLRIEGMMCTHCEARVKKALESVERVIEAQADWQKGIATIKASQSLSDEQLRLAVEAQDYSVKSVEVLS